MSPAMRAAPRFEAPIASNASFHDAFVRKLDEQVRLNVDLLRRGVDLCVRRSG